MPFLVLFAIVFDVDVVVVVVVVVVELLMLLKLNFCLDKIKKTKRFQSKKYNISKNLKKDDS